MRKQTTCLNWLRKGDEVAAPTPDADQRRRLARACDWASACSLTLQGGPEACAWPSGAIGGICPDVSRSLQVGSGCVISRECHEHFRLHCTNDHSMVFAAPAASTAAFQRTDSVWRKVAKRSRGNSIGVSPSSSRRLRTSDSLTIESIAFLRRKTIWSGVFAGATNRM